MCLNTHTITLIVVIITLIYKYLEILETWEPYMYVRKQRLLFSLVL